MLHTNVSGENDVRHRSPPRRARRGVVERWRQTGRVARGSLNVFWLPELAPFRRDPRFQDLVRELDMLRFWQRHGPPDGHAIENDKLVVL